jgi:hypothetical protein
MNKLDEVRTFKKYRWIKKPWYKPDELETYEVQMSIRQALKDAVWVDPYLIVEAMFDLVDEIEDLKKKLDK